MEEQAQKECKTKKCCAKCIIIVIVCSLVCFFAGYYAGTKSLAKVSRSAINQPFNPNGMPKMVNPNQINAIKNIPKTIIPNVQKPTIPNVQKPPVVNTPTVQAPKVNIPDSVKEKAQAQANNTTEEKK